MPSSPPMYSGMSQDTRVAEARVNNVNVSDFTVDVTTVRTMQIIADIPISVPYTHYSAGEGMYFMPDVGALCWICFPSDGNFPFVLGFSSPHDTATGSFRANRRQLEMGDQIILGRAGNLVYVRKNGIVEIAATPLARRLYIPVDNLIRDVAQNYKMNLAGGNWQWITAKDSEDPRGKVPIKFLMGIKEFADDKSALVTIEAAHGAAADDRDLLSDTGEIRSDADLKSPAFRLSVYEQGAHVRRVAVMEFEKDGTVRYTTEGDYIVDSQGDIKLTSLTGDIKLTSLTGDMNLNATKSTAIEALVSMSLTSPLIKLGGNIVISSSGGMVCKTKLEVGTSAAQMMSLLKESALIYLRDHIHADTVTGAWTGPPLNAGAMMGDKGIKTTLLKGA